MNRAATSRIGVHVNWLRWNRTSLLPRKNDSAAAVANASSRHGTNWYHAACPPSMACRSIDGTNATARITMAKKTKLIFPAMPSGVCWVSSSVMAAASSRAYARRSSP